MRNRRSTEVDCDIANVTHSLNACLSNTHIYRSVEGGLPSDSPLTGVMLRDLPATCTRDMLHKVGLPSQRVIRDVLSDLLASRLGDVLLETSLPSLRVVSSVLNDLLSSHATDTLRDSPTTSFERCLSTRGVGRRRRAAKVHYRAVEADVSCLNT